MGRATGEDMGNIWIYHGNIGLIWVNIMEILLDYMI
jgi:hypothetical protein